MIKFAMIPKVLVIIGLCGVLTPWGVEGIGWGAKLQQQQQEQELDEDSEVSVESVTRSIRTLARNAGSAAQTVVEVTARKNARHLISLLLGEEGDDDANKNGTDTGASAGTTGDGTIKTRLDCDYADPTKRHMCPPTDQLNHPAVDARSGRWAYIVPDQRGMEGKANSNNRPLGRVVVSDEVADYAAKLQASLAEDGDAATQTSEVGATTTKAVTEDNGVVVDDAGVAKDNTDEAATATAGMAAAPESPLVLFARCLDDPDDPACKELQGGSSVRPRRLNRTPSPAGIVATTSPTKDDCFGNMIDERFCASSQPSLSDSPSFVDITTPAPTTCEDRVDSMSLEESTSSDE